MSLPNNISNPLTDAEIVHLMWIATHETGKKSMGTSLYRAVDNPEKLTKRDIKHCRKLMLDFPFHPRKNKKNYCLLVKKG